MSAGIEFASVVKRYGDVAAVDGVSLEVAPGSFVSLLGPSGCGKTTLLRLVGGFEKPDAGTVRIGDLDVTTLAPQRRPTAMVFQSYALFPTMTVGENVEYGLRVRGVGKADRALRTARALERVDLGGLEARPVSALSGGQQQRVALARAIAVEPSVLLFDEPLSNLDLALREATRAELKSLQRDLGVTSLYVTHDQQEALALSDQIALMRAGRIVAVGSPEELYSDPPTAYAASFLGGANVIRDRALAERLSGEPMPHGSALVVRPEVLEPVDLEVEDAVEARVVGRQFLGLTSEWTIESGGQRLRAWTAPSATTPSRTGIIARRWRWVEDDAAPTSRAE
ncbi:ABC transporter ATP-binding protein [Rubrivirga sp.]|uniref:ABC transporter ATP-binding protein n=1 Tax=Rubrivirga sp. TaxID=1885344 RepID=UPI003C76F315